MEPQALALLAFVLVAMEFEAELTWHVSHDTPLIIAEMGQLGQVLQQAAFFTVFVGGVSILIWSFTKLAWYQPLLLLLGAVLGVHAIRGPVVLRAFLTSALIPPITAIGIVALQWPTWFAK